MIQRTLYASTIAFLLLGCGGGYKNVSTYTKQDRAVSDSKSAPAGSEDSIAQEFTSEDVEGMVAEPQSIEPQNAIEDEKSFAEAITPEQDEAAFAASDMAAEIEASFAKNNNAKAMGQVKALVKNLAAAAKNGKKSRTKKIAGQLLKAIEKNANQGQAKAKEQKAKVSELVKKIVDAANKNKKADLKKAVDDLIKLLS